MLKLIECGIIDVYLKLENVNEQWADDAKQKVDSNPKWSPATKTIRKSCLNSFYKFVQNDFDRKIIPYRRHLKPNEIKHILSNVQDKALAKDIPVVELSKALNKIIFVMITLLP